MDTSAHDHVLQEEPVWLPEIAAWPESPKDEVDKDRLRLEGEIAIAQQRTAAAWHRAADADVEMREVLKAEIAASRERLEEMEREYEVSIATIREDSQAEVARIMADARHQVARLRASRSNGSLNDDR